MALSIKALSQSFIIATFTAVFMAGCTGLDTGSGSGVSVLDQNTRAHVDTDLTMADYTAFAENVTNKMLSSRLVQNWGNKRPKLIVAKLRNNTDDESIRMQDVYDRITETILNAGVARLLDTSAVDFDYVVRTEMSSTRQYGDRGEELVFFKLEFKLFTIEGEMVGQWSDVLPLGKAKKRFL